MSRPCAPAVSLGSRRDPQGLSILDGRAPMQQGCDVQGRTSEGRASTTGLMPSRAARMRGVSKSCTEPVGGDPACVDACCGALRDASPAAPLLRARRLGVTARSKIGVKSLETNDRRNHGLGAQNDIKDLRPPPRNRSFSLGEISVLLSPVCGLRRRANETASRRPSLRKGLGAARRKDRKWRRKPLKSLESDSEMAIPAGVCKVA